MTLRNAIKDDDLMSVRRRLVRCDVTYRDMHLAVSRNHPHIVKAVMKKFATSSIESRIVECEYFEDTNTVRQGCTWYDDCKKRIQCNMCYVIDIALALRSSYALTLALEIHVRSVGMRVKRCAPDDWFPNASFDERCHITELGMERYATFLLCLQNTSHKPESTIECAKVLLDYGANPLFIFADLDGYSNDPNDGPEGYNTLAVVAFRYAPEVWCSHILERCIAICPEFTRDQIGRCLLIHAFRRGFVSIFERLLFLGVNVGNPQRHKNVSYSIGDAIIKTDSLGILKYAGSRIHEYVVDGKWCGNYFHPLIYPFIQNVVGYTICFSRTHFYEKKERMLDLLICSGVNPSSGFRSFHSPIEYLTLGYKMADDGNDDLPVSMRRDFLLERFRTFHQRISLRIISLIRLKIQS